MGHVVVIGAGAAGCATAYYLSAAGVRVTLVESEGVGIRASGWSAGGINPLHGIPAPIAALAMESYRLHLALWPQLERLTGRALEARHITMAMVAPDGLPIIGRVPDRDGVYVATGGGPKGILLAPAMGLAVAELILTGRTSLSVGSSAPERFLQATT